MRNKVVSHIYILTMFFSIGIFIFSTQVLAQQTVRSQPFNTRVGAPTDPEPGNQNIDPGTAGPIGFSVSCPMSSTGEGSFRFICGTAKNYANNCGHGAPEPYYLACTAPPYAVCPFSDQLKAAVDIRPQSGNGNGVPVYFPYINGEAVNWTLVSGPINLAGGTWGVKLEYIATYKDKKLRIDFSHLNQGSGPGAGLSGTQVGVVKSGFDTDGGGHLHVALSVNGRWVDSISEAQICTNK